MTAGSTSNNHHPLHPRDDRETLSALFDGELAGDAMRFALKRLDHDTGWRDTCGRWLLIGDALRGEAAVAAPSEFASGVTRLLAAESGVAFAAAPGSQQAVQAALSTQGSARRRWVGGAALAASVAIAAVLVVRPVPEPTSPAPDAQMAGVAAPATATQAAVPPPGQALVPDSIAPASAAGGSSVPGVAVADAPQPTASRRTGRSARAATQPVGSATTPPVGETANAVASAEPAARPQPFHPPTDEIVTRPWPRAVLPGTAGADALTVDFGADPASPSFYPFEPRLPSQDPASATQAPEPQR